MSEETKDNLDLPPACKPSKLGDTYCLTPWSEHAHKRAVAWQVAIEAMDRLGWTLAEYESVVKAVENLGPIMRDHRAMELLREATGKKAMGYIEVPTPDSTAIEWTAEKHNKLPDDPADAIIATLDADIEIGCDCGDHHSHTCAVNGPFTHMLVCSKGHRWMVAHLPVDWSDHQCSGNGDPGSSCDERYSSCIKLPAEPEPEVAVLKPTPHISDFVEVTISIETEDGPVDVDSVVDGDWEAP